MYDIKIPKGMLDTQVHPFKAAIQEAIHAFFGTQEISYIAKFVDAQEPDSQTQGFLRMILSKRYIAEFNSDLTCKKLEEAMFSIYNPMADLDARHVSICKESITEYLGEQSFAELVTIYEKLISLLEDDYAYIIDEFMIDLLIDRMSEDEPLSLLRRLANADHENDKLYDKIKGLTTVIVD